MRMKKAYRLNLEDAVRKGKHARNLELLKQTEEYKNSEAIDGLLIQMIKNAEEAAKNGETTAKVKELYYGIDFGDPSLNLLAPNKDEPPPKGEDLIGITRLLWDCLIEEGIEPKIKSKTDGDFTWHSIIIDLPV